MNWALIKNYFPCSICLVISSLVRNDRSNLNSSIVLECSNSNVLLWWLWSLIWFSLHIYNQQSLGKTYTSSLFRPLSNLFTFFFCQSRVIGASGCTDPTKSEKCYGKTLKFFLLQVRFEPSPTPVVTEPLTQWLSNLFTGYDQIHLPIAYTELPKTNQRRS